MARATLAGLPFVAALLGLSVAAAAFAQVPVQAPSRQKPLAQSLPPDARRDYDAGKLLFEDGDYATALLKYRAAYDRTRDPRLLWNVAVCQKDLRHYAKAAATLERYLAEGSHALSAADRHDAQELLRAIAPFTVPMTVRVSEPGAEVFIDDVLVGRSPLPGPVSLDMGTRRVRVRKDGFRQLDEEFPVGGSAPTTVDLELHKQAGRLQLEVPADTHVFVDDREVGRGPHLDLELPVGAHAMKIIAPRMRPLQTDVLVEDGKTRKLDLTLEPETAPVAEVHVAVTCLGDDPLSQDDLVVFFDDATESALPLGVRIRREPGHEVVAYVAYRVAPGHHTVHVASPRCDASDATVDVREGGVADVRGSLSPRNKWLEGSPAGSPDGWRLAAGLLESSATFSQYEAFFSSAVGHI
ncbi:MAG: PEGA domain-containing protein, partial [Polyangiaceae bacterium]